ncbi:hypothetical protein EDD29_5170 [Actinocorallia herbida]|uniref:Ricin-type beta-trefoil lectin protein n=1 Tax=Actinocorallia herbida TaxID=58109 RepID=A0A3N1D3C9_9ACTN|nr:hypothetical protein [Actinocorallia herbida]ROO87558.1 hypothetical protein EDD29_5170 [Actinocorallia herbida]
MSTIRGLLGRRMLKRVLCAGLPVLSALVAAPPGAAASASDPNVLFIHKGRYQFRDMVGRCLASSPFLGYAFVTTCNGNALQTWTVRCPGSQGPGGCTWGFDIRRDASDPDEPDACLGAADISRTYADITHCSDRETTWVAEWSPSFNRYLLVNKPPNGVGLYMGVATLSGTTIPTFFSERGEGQTWTVFAVA